MSTSRTADPGEARAGSVARVRAAAERLGLEIEILRLDEGTRTAEQAARACGCAVAQIVKSIVFRVAGGGDGHALFLTGGASRVDPAKAAALVGAPLEKADAEAVRAQTGFAIGGVAPIGALRPLPSWFDRGLLAHDRVWAAAGSPNHVFVVDPRLLQAATGATVAEFAAAAQAAGDAGRPPR